MKCQDCKKETNTKSQRCPECQKIYHQKWLEELKLWAIQKLGDKCFHCDKHFDSCVYDFHHEGTDTWLRCNEQQKNANRRVKELVRWRRAEKIPENVRLVCANCHRIISHKSFNHLIK
jgi:RNA polymerase subunit RPABC4/transcription elongation factor Spt4